MMTISEAIKTIETFTSFSKQMFPGSDQGSEILPDYEEFPRHVQEYIEQIIPDSKDIRFRLTGDRFVLLCIQNMDEKKLDIAFESGLEGSSWVDKWLVIAHQSRDPFCLHLMGTETNVVRFYYNGKAGLGDPVTVADSVGQFLLCAYAVDYALTAFKDPIVQRKKSVDISLAPEPAKWLFPKMKKWAGKYYEEWCGEFQNSNEEQ